MSQHLRRVVLESPYAGSISLNRCYARAAILDCLRRGEAPIASHLLFPTVIDDDNHQDRAAGIAAGHAWIPFADALVVYCDLHITAGMAHGIHVARKSGIPVEYRTLEAWDERKTA